MNKQNAPSSYNSGTSSETSETQSVEDNNTSGLGTPETGTPRNTVSSRALKVWKRMKESTIDKEAAEAKRPPWRAVSVSTLPKPDKNALLRAKLLDASRRLRAGKSSIAVQTDIVPTKLMKEVNHGVQLDLIDYKDVGMLTDGSFTMKREGTGEFILTYSVSQMTEAVPVQNSSTQTLLPRVPGDGFIEAYYNKDQDKLNLNEFSPIEQKLLKQIRDIREARKKQPLHKSSICNDLIDNIFSEDSLSGTGTDTDTTDSKTTVEEVSHPTLNQRSFLKPTYSSWNFNFDDENDCGKFFQPYNILRGRPSTSSEGTDRKLLLHTNLDVGPKHVQEYRTVNMNSFYINAIDELILESNNLVDFIEDLCARNEKNKSHSLQEVDLVLQRKVAKPIFPSEHWLPIIEKQEKDSAEIRNILKYPKIRRVKKFDLKTEF